MIQILSSEGQEDNTEEEMTYQDVIADTQEEPLEAEIRGGPMIQIPSSEGQEDDTEEEMETGPQGDVESPAPEEDQVLDQVVPGGRI